MPPGRSKALAFFTLEFGGVVFVHRYTQMNTDGPGAGDASPDCKRRGQYLTFGHPISERAIVTAYLC